MLKKRRNTNIVSIGDLRIGGNQPIRIQSMLTSETTNVDACIQEIKRLDAVGCEIIRLTVPNQKSIESLCLIKQEMKKIGINRPLVADIHFNPQLAINVCEFVEKVRINPGNFADQKKFKKREYSDLEYEDELEKIEKKILPLIKNLKKYGCALRIGTNHGSLSDRIMNRFGDTSIGMVESAMEYLRIFRKNKFNNIVLSMKASNSLVMIDSYRLLVKKMDSEKMFFPLHLGVTEAGPPPEGLIKSTAGIGTLLMEGIGDTIRYSLTADPVEEARAGRKLLESLGLRELQNVDLIACPSCGRAEVDVYALAEEAQKVFATKKLPLQIAIMGCVVNGPGEARGADLGIAAGNKRGHLFVQGRNVAVVEESEMVEALVEWAEYIVEHGVDAALERVDLEKAEKEAEKDREKLLMDQGDDVNHGSQKVELIRKL